MAKHQAVSRETAKDLLSRAQTIVLAVCLVAVLAGLVTYRHKTIIIGIALSMVFWLTSVGFRLVLGYHSLGYRPTTIAASVDDPTLPNYTIYLPVHREVGMVQQLTTAMRQLEYPTDRLQILFLVEANDLEMRDAIEALDLPRHFEIVTIPAGGPTTKPNGLNVGLARATGEFCVIFDAEDIPEPDQLLKAVGTFRVASADVACLQARLAFSNGAKSWITRFYWAEYITHFEWVLGGLAKLGMIPPLGGTSNHFRTSVLRQVAIAPEQLPNLGVAYVGGWDPYNVTEDAELAGALAMAGYRVQMIDSVTWETAPLTIRKAVKQRSRWLKGYAHTGLVYTRHPGQSAKAMGWRNYLGYILVLLGTPLSLFLNPLFWGATVVYFATRTTVIVRLFPLPLFYSGVALMVVGNLLLFYQMVVACLHRHGYGGVKCMLLLPVWWAITSWAGYIALLELVRPSKRHFWNKTMHEVDPETVAVLAAQALAAS